MTKYQVVDATTGKPISGIIPEYQEAVKIRAKIGGHVQEIPESGPSKSVPDHLNPDYIFSATDDKLLVKIMKGDISPMMLASRQLAYRGLNEHGVFVGFRTATELHIDRYPNDRI